MLQEQIDPSSMSSLGAATDLLGSSGGTHAAAGRGTTEDAFSGFSPLASLGSGGGRGGHSSAPIDPLVDAFGFPWLGSDVVGGGSGGGSMFSLARDSS